MVKIATFFFFGIMSLANAAATAKSLPERIDEKAVLPSGLVVKISVSTIEFSSTAPQSVAFRWGADDSPKLKPPLRVIAEMDVFIGKEKIVLPLSAFADLCDPSKLAIIPTKRGFVAKIKGSDAGGAYEASLYFEKLRITRRKVISSENPRNVWEETTYHNEFPENW